MHNNCSPAAACSTAEHTKHESLLNDLKNLLQVRTFGSKKERREKRGGKKRTEGEKVDLGKLCLLAQSPLGCVFYTDSESALSHLSDNAFIIKFHICI